MDYMGNGPVEGVMISILKHKRVSLKSAPYFCCFLQKVLRSLLSQNIIKLILFGASNSKYEKSAFSIRLYRVLGVNKDFCVVINHPLNAKRVVSTFFDIFVEKHFFNCIVLLVFLL